MSNTIGSFETAYANLLTALWEELEDLLDAYYGRRAVSPEGVDRLRLKLAEFRQRLVYLVDQTDPYIRQSGVKALQAASLSGFAVELLRLLDVDYCDDAFDLSCGTTMVRAQSRILDEAQRFALARR